MPKLTIAEFKRRHFRGASAVAPARLNRVGEAARRRLLGLPAVAPDFARKAFAFLEGKGPMPRPAKGRRPTLERRRLSECCDQAGPLNAADYTLVGVRVLGASSLNRRRYTAEAMADALPMYRNAKVFLDHPDRPNGSRSVRDLIGVLDNPEVEGDGLKADLALVPTHPFAPAIAWLAKNRPNALGLSHNAVGEGATENGTFTVRRIVSVRSVDLVIDPATVKGLFS